MKIRTVFQQRPVSFEYRIEEKHTEEILASFRDKEFASLAKQLPLNKLTSIFNIGTGIEVELENVKMGEVPHPWLTVRDNSLRNNGLEFITRVGKRMYSCLIGLEKLFVSIKENGYQTSDRTSMHVHLNVSDMTLNQLRNMYILYVLLEQPLMSYVEPLRRNNIFCVPITDSPRLHYNSDVEWDMQDMIRGASKYCAFNLKSVSEHGTIEFRQMHVPKDMMEAGIWILMLGALKRYAAHTPPSVLQDKIFSLKTSSQYDLLLNDIFFGLEKYIRYSADELDEAVTDCKLLFAGI